ncbi:uncharacterized protein LOC142472200 [Ascaphus truei]|uniref:uncharacterized protein LOC142472200 n=1 Tax=Ascaphus truei TaxID=8439 RepID=UPI003F5A22A7
MQELGICASDTGSLLPLLLSPLPHAMQQAVEHLVCDLQTDREQLVGALLKDTQCKQYIAALFSLLEAPDIRMCSNVAYILGTVAEDQAVALLLVELAESSADWDLLGRLGAMLLWEDAEAAMNAAGALGTLAENDPGRRWILASPDSDFIIENITALLGSPRDWTASNCALVLARICMCQEGCARLLDHPKSDVILRKLIASLQVDEAGCGLNAAFTLGRLCDTDAGRRRVLCLQEADDMIAALEALMSGGDAGGSRNACFALTSLVTDPAGHQHVLRSQYFTRVLDTLCCLLQSEEQESCWFAAMTVKVLSSHPQGVVRLRQHQLLETILRKVATSHTVGKELLEEVGSSLKKLQRLPQPPPPVTKILVSGSVWVAWEEHIPHSGLPVTYSLFDGERLLYQGPSCSYLFLDCRPGQKHRLKVVMETEGDRSSDSPVTAVTVEEPLPSCPLNFQVIGRTATQVKLSWSPPADAGATIKYYMVFQEEVPVETTTELSCIVGGLFPSTNYTFTVCACTSRSQGQKVSLVAPTMDKGDHAPGKLTLYVIGRSEIFITWEVPRVSLGRFFNYELYMNGKPVYLGTQRSYTARRLTPNTEYTCTVCAITSEGRYESRPVTKRTAKDEYSNLNKNNISSGSTQPAILSLTSDIPDPTEKQLKIDGTSKPSPAKSQNARLVMSRKTSISRENKVHAPKSRRDSLASWSTESSEGTKGPLPAPTQPASPCDAPVSQPEKSQPGKSRQWPDENRGSPGKRVEVSPNRSTGVSPQPAKQCPVRVPDNVSTPPVQSRPSPDNKKPQSELCLRPMPVAVVCSRAPEYRLWQRAKTDGELVRPPPGDKQDPAVRGRTFNRECSIESEKEKSLSHKKMLQPMRDPLRRFGQRNQKCNSWDITGALWNGGGKFYSLCGKCPMIAAREDKIHPAAAKNVFSKDSPLSPTAGASEGRQQAWSQLQCQLSQIQSFQNMERKTGKLAVGRRIGKSLPRKLHKDVLALVGASGVTLRLPLAPNNMLISLSVSPHH